MDWKCCAVNFRCLNAYVLQVTAWRCVATHKINTHLLLMLQKRPHKQSTQRFGGRFCHVLCVKIS